VMAVGERVAAGDKLLVPDVNGAVCNGTAAAAIIDGVGDMEVIKAAMMMKRAAAITVRC